MNKLLTRLTAALLFAVLMTLSALASARNYADLYDALSPAVVTLHTGKLTASGVKSSGIGSGVLIDGDLVMTAAHVVHTADRITVKFKDGYSTSADIVSSISASDVALVKLANPPENPVIAPMGDSDKARVGEPVFIIGAPFGIEQTLSVGNLSGRMNRGHIAGGEPMVFLQTDTAINQGNSGGPMFNLGGEVIGIVSFILSKSGGFNGIGFAAAINSAQKSLLERSAFWTGFDGIMLPPRVAAALNVPQATGLLVQHVVGGSVADKAGLKGGTLETTLDGREIRLGGDVVLAIHDVVCDGPHDFENIKERLGELSPEDSFTIKVLRGGEVIDLHAIAETTRKDDLRLSLLGAASR